MKNLVDSPYVLRILWRYLGDIFYRYNLKYLILPVIYLLVMMLTIPKPIVIDNVTETITFNSYAKLEITKEDKVAAILKKYNLSKEEFKVLCGIVLAEAESNSYEDAYAVINTIYNRTHSKNWVKSAERNYGKDKGTSLYYQAIKPGQFTVYKSGSYLRHINDTTSVGYEAIIDFLYTEDIMHNYLSFRSHNIKVKGSEAFSSKGNNYFNVLTESNWIS